MTDSGVSTSELSRQLRENTAAQKELSQTLKDLRSEIAQTYVRQDVYDRDQVIHENHRREIQEDVKALVSQRDWVVRTVLGLIIVALVGLVIASGQGVV